MSKQAKKEFAMQGDAYSIYLCDSYIVHHPAVAEEDTWRTWIRITYSVKDFDKKGNTINPAFGPVWEFKDRLNPFRKDKKRNFFGPCQGMQNHVS